MANQIFKKSIQENILLYLLRLYCMMRSPFDLRNLLTSEAVGRRCSAKMVFLEISQNSLENTWHQACNFIKSEALAQVFSCEFFEISKNTFFPQNESGGCFCNNIIFRRRPN